VLYLRATVITELSLFINMARKKLILYIGELPSKSVNYLYNWFIILSNRPS